MLVRGRRIRWWGIALCLTLGTPLAAQDEVDAIEVQVANAVRARHGVQETLSDRWQGAAAERGVGTAAWQERLARGFRRASARQLAAALNAGSYEEFLNVLSGAISPEGLLRGSAEAPQPVIFGDPNKNLTYTPIVPCRVVDTRRAGSPGEVGILGAGQRRTWDARGAFDFSFQGGDVSCPELESVNPRAFAVVVTATGYTNSGSLKLFEAGSTSPYGAALTFYKGVQKTVANGLIVRSCTTCADQIEALASGAGTHVAVDILGFFQRAEFPVPSPPELVFVGETIGGGCNTVGLAPGTTSFAISQPCPHGTVVVAGSCFGSFENTMAKAYLSEDRWVCEARNPTSTAKELTACPICLRARIEPAL